MKIIPLSEKTVAIQIPEKTLTDRPEWTIYVAQWLNDHRCPGFVAVVPAFATITVWYDPMLVRLKYGSGISPSGVVVNWLNKNLPDTFVPSPPSAPVIEIPVSYGGADLAEVARALDLTEQEVIRLHVAGVYTVLMIGFLPGFPYLGFLPSALALPRKKTPAISVPAGSVAIAGRQTGIYPQSSPGGWHVIGHTDFSLFSPDRRPPATLQPGWKVQFVPLVTMK